MGIGRYRRPVARHGRPASTGLTATVVPVPVRRDVPPPDLCGPRPRAGASGPAGEVVRWAWDGAVELGAIGPDRRRGRRFGAFGAGSVICFPPTAIVNERSIHIGAGTMIGPHVTLSAGMVPGQQLRARPGGAHRRPLPDRQGQRRSSATSRSTSATTCGPATTSTSPTRTTATRTSTLPISPPVAARAAGAHRRRLVARPRHGRAPRRDASAATSSWRPARW